MTRDAPQFFLKYFPQLIPARSFRSISFMSLLYRLRAIYCCCFGASKSCMLFQNDLVEIVDYGSSSILKAIQITRAHQSQVMSFLHWYMHGVRCFYSNRCLSTVRVCSISRSIDCSTFVPVQCMRSHNYAYADIMHN